MSQRAAVEFLALLVHRGLLSEATARAVMARLDEPPADPDATGDGGSGDGDDDDADPSPEPPAVRKLAAILAQRGDFSIAEVQELWRTRAGEIPTLSRYVIHEELGRGGTARVFRAIDKTDGTEVALKVLDPALAGEKKALSRFVQESRLLTALRHANIVEGYRVGREKDTYYLAMELVEGETAVEPLHRGEIFSEADGLVIVLQVARALEYLHSQGLVHRDIKPGNIIWTPERRAVLIDLGFAASAATGEAGADAAGGDQATTVGTVEYIAPEQARGKTDLDTRADIYSLGATLYHLTVGDLPFVGNDNEEILRKQVMESLSSEKIRARRLSPHLHYFIEKMMAKEREIRYQTPALLIADMEAQLKGREALEIPARPPVRRPRRPPPSHRRRPPRR